MSRCGAYAFPDFPATPVASTSVGSDGLKQNGAGTCQKQWHKSDTTCSRAVHGLENENPGALAGATGIKIDVESFFSEIDHNLKREAAARVLARAVADCEPADRLPFLETLIEGLCQGGPLPAFGGVMAAARDWASWATRAELKAYAVATFEAMGQRDQAAFLGYLDRRAVA